MTALRTAFASSGTGSAAGGPFIAGTKAYLMPCFALPSSVRPTAPSATTKSGGVVLPQPAAEAAAGVEELGAHAVADADAALDGGERPVWAD